VVTDQDRDPASRGGGHAQRSTDGTVLFTPEAKIHWRRIFNHTVTDSKSDRF